MQAKLGPIATLLSSDYTLTYFCTTLLPCKQICWGYTRWNRIRFTQPYLCYLCNANRRKKVTFIFVIKVTSSDSEYTKDSRCFIRRCHFYTATSQSKKTPLILYIFWHKKSNLNIAFSTVMLYLKCKLALTRDYAKKPPSFSSQSAPCIYSVIVADFGN